MFALAHATGKSGRFTLIERWRCNERLLAPNEQPLKVRKTLLIYFYAKYYVISFKFPNLSYSYISLIAESHFPHSIYIFDVFLPFFDVYRVPTLTYFKIIPKISQVG